MPNRWLHMKCSNIESAAPWKFLRSLKKGIYTSHQEKTRKSILAPFDQLMAIVLQPHIIIIILTYYYIWYIYKYISNIIIGREERGGEEEEEKGEE